MPTYSPQITDLLPKVYEQSSHPEMESETVRAIRAAVQYYHKLDFLKFDTKEVAIPWNATAGRFEIDTATLLPGFREVEAMHGLDNNGNIVARFEETTPDHLFDMNGDRRNNIFYLAGSSIQLITDAAPTQLLVNYFSMPPLGADNLYTWLLPDNEEAIIDFACWKIFGILGQKERIASHQAMVQLHTQQIIQNYSRFTGR